MCTYNNTADGSVEISELPHVLIVSKARRATAIRASSLSKYSPDFAIVSPLIVKNAE